jgi:hypothetical protein
MRKRPSPRPSLGQTLKAIVLATPFVNGVACFPYPPQGPCPISQNAFTFTLADLRAAGFDGGLDGGDCMAACETVFYGPTSPAIDGGLQECEFGSDGVWCNGLVRNSCGGRRPASLLASGDTEAPNAIGAFFAEAARLEAASVCAFRVLARELAAHGAPRHLISAARRSAREELNHTRSTRQLAFRYGATPLRATFAEQPPIRSLEEVASENAAEGCARETYDATVNLWQGIHAKDPVVASAMRTIGDDETKHAELGWAVAQWIEPRLSVAARNRVRQVRASAFADLTTQIQPEPPPSVLVWTGYPSRASREHLLKAVSAAVREEM